MIAPAFQFESNQARLHLRRITGREGWLAPACRVFHQEWRGQATLPDLLFFFELFFFENKRS